MASKIRRDIISNVTADCMILLRSCHTRSMPSVHSLGEWLPVKTLSLEPE
jgi:hypothetical protein